MPAIARAFFTLVTLTRQRKGPVNSRYRNTRNDWMFQGFAPQHDEDVGRTRHPERSEGSS